MADPTMGCPKELRLPRPHLHRLLAERSGHGDFKAYHLRFRHRDARLRCSCGLDTAPGHFLTCCRTRRPDLLNKMRGRTLHRDEVLTTTEGALALSRWLAATAS